MGSEMCIRDRSLGSQLRAYARLGTLYQKGAAAGLCECCAKLIPGPLFALSGAPLAEEKKVTGVAIPFPGAQLAA